MPDVLFQTSDTATLPDATTVAFNAGVTSDGTQRVINASDDPGVVSLATLDDIVHNEDAAHSSGHGGVPAWGVHRSALTAAPNADGDYTPLDVNDSGQLRVEPSATKSVTATLTRPSDTNAYAADDSVSSSTSAPTVVTLSAMARANGLGGRIRSAFMVDSAYSATPGQFESWLLDTTATPTNDNAAFAPTDAHAKTVVAHIVWNLSYPGDKTVGTNGNRLYVGTVTTNDGHFKCAAADTALYLIHAVRNAYTPISGELFDFKFIVDQD
jgi:hypothetical protein